MSNLHECIDKLQSDSKIERDRATLILKQIVESETSANCLGFADEFLHSVETAANTEWKKSFAFLVFLKLILSKPNYTLDINKYLPIVLKLLENDEARVRVEAALLVGKIAEKKDQNLIFRIYEKIFGLIIEGLEKSEQPVDQETFPAQEVDALLCRTGAWRHLETTLMAYNYLINNFQYYHKNVIGKNDILTLITCSKHKNRFVRETTMTVFNTLCHDDMVNFFATTDLLQDVEKCIISCLTDNWSQVRLAASIAARRFILSMQNLGKSLENSEMLPAICINRHYLAEGVKIFNVKSWEIITNGQGMQIVKNNIDLFVKFYVSQANADNHAVREAACHCLTELSYLLGPCVHDKHLGIIYDCLILCFKDDSWPVRDTACFAMGVNLAMHPRFFKEKLQEIFPLFLNNLTNSIQSVRVGASIAFAYAFNTFPNETFEYLDSFVAGNLDKVKDQPKDYETHAGFSKDHAKFGVVETMTDSQHVDQIMYSCGSLAPKMRSGASKAGGCSSSHGFTRASLPWEYTDACIILLGELSKLYTQKNVEPDNIIKFKVVRSSEAAVMARTFVRRYVEKIKECLKYKDFEHHVNIFKTFFNYYVYLLAILEVNDVDSEVFNLFMDEFHYGLTSQAGALECNVDCCINELIKRFKRINIRRIFTEYYGEKSPITLHVISIA